MAGNDGGKYRVALNELLDNVLYPATASEVLDCMCNMFEKQSFDSTYNSVNGISAYPTSGGGFPSQSGLRIYSSAYNTNDINLWKAFLANTHLQVVYKLATPIEIQLTPVQVKTLLNNNNISADTGNIEKLVYFKTGCENIVKLIEAMIQ